MCHVTWPRPFQGHFVICRLGLAMFNPYTKYEVSTITCNEEMKGNVKWLVGKRMVDFLLAIIKLFSPTVTVEAL